MYKFCEERARAEKQAYANQAGGYTDAGCSAPHDTKVASESLLEQLYTQKHFADVEAGRRQRAIEILERHPEFEEFRELISIVGL